jgi:hypothetical protein
MKPVSESEVRTKKNTNRCEAVNLERLLYVFLCQLLFKYTTGQIDCASTYNATHGHFSTFAQSIREDLQVSSGGIKNSLTEESLKRARAETSSACINNKNAREATQKRGQNKNIKCLMPWRWRWHFNIVASVEGVEK